MNIPIHTPSWWEKDTSKKEVLIPVYRERFQNLLISKLIDIQNEFPNYSLYGVADWISQNIGQAWVYNGQKLTYNYLYYFNQLSLAWYQYTMNDGQPISLNLVNRIISTTGKFKNYRISAADVAEGIQTALILRDKKTLDYLANVPVSFTEQSNQDDLLLEIMMVFYQMLAKGNGNSKEVQATFQAISEQLDWETYKRYIPVEGFNQLWVWERIFKARKEYAESISLPVINIYYQIVEANQAGFESAVQLALERWKAYYTRIWIDENQEEVDRSLWGQGYLALPITAACAYGYDYGLTLTNIESDYIPVWLTEGNFQDMELLIKD